MGNGNLGILRLLGYFSHLITAILLFYCMRLILRERKESYSPYIACAIYLTHPLTIQSSLILDIDTTLLVPAVFLLTYIFVTIQKPSLLSYICSTFLAFSTKLTTPIPIVLMGIASRLRSDSRKKILFAGLILGFLFTTIFIYMISKYLGTSWCDPFRYVFNAFLNKSNKNLLDISIALIRTVLWFSPYLILLSIIMLPDIYHENETIQIKWIALLIGGVFFGYLFIGGVLHGFPKYHVPILSLIIFLIFLNSRINIELNFINVSVLIIFICISVFFFLLIAPDPLLLVNYDLRNYMLDGFGGKEVIQKAIIFITGFTALPIVFFIINKRVMGKDTRTLIVIILIVCTLRL